ncbi:ATP-dependent RNA helicase dbp-5 [Pestalotiopsis fici W106-1]|uniref:RNA helicase n=1 Tax=Pestalotiopsis fici (strain W106-1 / CGMCC3.15140) TaxID=1229662 RepID=W3XAV0_PESFW|nr:ATP-dependent RNA helicase dbp-5 [Pestalotiopsis fici W106-1]ETS82276.1 ATP-dependent RNA helicase dbp-5 [Pestalotiopsis fici W106-1]
MSDLASRITKPEGDVAAVPEGADGAGDVAGTSNLQQVDYDVEVSLNQLQQDQDHPLGSAKSFEELGLPDAVLKGLLALQFHKPSKVQEKALPLMLADPPQNMIAQSQSGTGKTAAFVTTVLSRVDMSNPTQPQALILAPTRELARQIQGVVQHIGQFCEGLVVEAAVPGNIARDQKVEANVICATPGTVMDLIRRRQIDASQFKVLVIDEADNMLDQQGLGDQCARVKNMIPKTVQILLFSATFPDVVHKYATKFAPNANQIKLKVQELTVRGISQMFMDCPSEADKYGILCQLYGLLTIGSSIIFVKTRESANEIQKRMTEDGHKVTALHGAFEGAARDALIDEFRSGRTKVLITTNVLARGIDVSSVNMVINYDVPMKGPGDREPDAETYLHRIGRTGRFGRVGVSITFIFDKKSFEALQNITERYEIDLIRLVPDDWDTTEAEVQRVIKSSRAQAGFNPSAQ